MIPYKIYLSSIYFIQINFFFLQKHPLPRYWSISDRTHHSLNISADALRARYKGRYGR